MQADSSLTLCSSVAKLPRVQYSVNLTTKLAQAAGVASASMVGRVSFSAAGAGVEPALWRAIVCLQRSFVVLKTRWQPSRGQFIAAILLDCRFVRR